jgi:hypothetical protein
MAGSSRGTKADKSNKFTMTETIRSMLSDHNGITLAIKHKTILEKFPSIWNLNDIPQNNTWVKDKLTKKTAKYFELNENEHTICQNLRRKFKVFNTYTTKEKWYQWFKLAL